MLTAATLARRDVAAGTHSPLPGARLYPAGVELFSQGAPVEDLWHVEHGLVKLRRLDDRGSEVILDLAFAGAWLGTAAVVAGLCSPASAVTCTATRIARVPAAGIRERLAVDREFSLFIHDLHAQELCRQAERIADLTSLSALQRLRRVMHRFVTALGPLPSTGEVRLQLPVHHWELAGLLAVTPEHLSRLLGVLQREGVIRRAKGWVIVTDVRRLCPEADDVDLRMDARMPRLYPERGVLRHREE